MRIDEFEVSDINKTVSFGDDPFAEKLKTAEYVADLNGFEILFDDSDPAWPILFLVDMNKEIKGVFELNAKGNNVYETNYSRLHHSVQGKGLGYRMYLFMLQELEWVLLSGDSLSPGAVKLWTRLIAHPNTLAWVENDGKKTEVFINPDGEIDGIVNPYSKEYMDKRYTAHEDQRDTEHELNKMHSAGEIDDEEYSRLLDKNYKAYRTERKALEASTKAQIYLTWVA